jgi:methylenetetrahydrofolate dehydrogenase (NADP+)/methenyltetrahydrofolate cyclohydrolase
MLKTLNINLAGMRATVVGASNNVGRPMALELLLENCTVTICNSKTVDLQTKVGQAELVVVAAGIKNIVMGEWIRQDAIVIDIGINRVDGKLVGDVEFSVGQRKSLLYHPSSWWSRANDCCHLNGEYVISAKIILATFHI